MKELVLFITCRLHIGTHFYHFQRLLRIELIWFSLINTIIKFSEISFKLLFMKIWFDILFSNWWMFIYCKMDSGDCVMKRVTEWEEPTLVFCSCNSRYDGEDGDSGEDSGDHLTRTVRGPGVRSEAGSGPRPPVLLPLSSLSPPYRHTHRPPRATSWHFDINVGCVTAWLWGDIVTIPVLPYDNIILVTNIPRNFPVAPQKEVTLVLSSLK